MKRFFLLLASTLFSVICFSQANFVKQIKAIIADSANDFQRFKGATMESPDTSLLYFFSTITLEGTTDNAIMLHRNIGSYDAVIKDSVTKRAGEKILADWKMTLQPILGSSFILSKGDFGGSYIKDSWYFTNRKVSVFLGLEQYLLNKRLYAVTFSISHEHEHLR